MARIRTLPRTGTTDTSKEEHLFTSVRIKRSSYTKDLIAETDAFGVELDAARAEERSLIEADAETSAAVQFADQDLDDSVEFVGDNTDLHSLLGVRLFGNLRPSELKKSLVGGQLITMIAWPEILTQSEKAVLESHAPLLSERVAVGIAAEKEKQGTSNKLADFRAVGTRVQLNDDHNAFRKSLYGKLGEIQHTNYLPSGWAESFFMQEPSDGRTVSELDRKISAAETELDSLKEQREALKAHDAKVATTRTEAVRKEKMAKIEALTKAKAELEAKESALREELAQDEGEPKPEPRNTPM